MYRNEKNQLQNLMNCKNCGTEINSKFCPNCGHPAQLKKIDGHYIIHEFEHILHLERGILYTIKELLIHPGQSIRHYLSENRSRLVKPIIFIIVTSLIYMLCNHYFHFEDGYVKYYDTNESTTVEIFKWVREHYGYANIVMGFFIVLWAKVFFRKSKYNFFEILILLCFVMGMGMLIYAVFGVIEGITHIKLMWLAGVLAFVYTTFAIGQFFGGNKIVNYIKAFFAYILGVISFSFAAIFIGWLIDLILKR